MELVKISIRKLVWDDWNVKHIGQHRIIPSEVEIMLSDRKAVFFATYGSRIVALGRSGKRLLAVVLAKEKPGRFYVVTARDMAKKERAIYRKGV